MRWDCSSAPRMLTTLQHQRTYCVYSMNLVAIGSMYMYLYMYVLVCIGSSAQAQPCMLPTCFVNGSHEIQCTSCPVGFGVQVIDWEFMRCSDSPPRNTKCEPCIAGVSFSDMNDLKSKCLGCRSCHSKKEVMTEECTPESDRECICKEEQYYYEDGVGSCVKCTTCGEDQEETRPCTPTENRECGPRSIPNVTTTSVLPTPNQTMLTVSTDPPDTGMSTKAEPDDKPLSGGMIALVVIVGFFGVAIAIIACIFLCRRRCKRTRDTSIGQESGGESPESGDERPVTALYYFNCCIGTQTNNNQIPAIATVSMSGVNGSNGTAEYHQVPSRTDTEPNGVVDRQSNGVIGRQLNRVNGRQPNMINGRQQSATSSTTEEAEHQQSVEDALGFSAEILERVITMLEDNDMLGRNAHMLADQFLPRETFTLLASSNTPAYDVLEMWVQQGKTKADLIQALRGLPMCRDDIANICEEDSADS